MKKNLSLIVILLLSTQVMAEQVKKGPLLDKKKFSIGAGIASNSVGVFDETGFQFFAAYDLQQVNLMDDVNTSIEVGYMDYGFSNADAGGIWGTVLLDGAINNKLSWIARAGLDIGDDSGLMVGAGVGMSLDARMALRFEYVVRDDIDSIQLNLRYHM